jgi:hypothetical protein
MERIAFLVERTGARLSGLLNPDSVVMRRTAGIRPRHSTGGQFTGARLSDDPLLFTGGGVTELTLDLLFDVTLAGSSPATEDVRDLTRPLWDLSENADDVRQPPYVRFVWGKSWNILGVVTAIAERVEQFTPAGVPQRSWLRLRLRRVDQASLGLPQEPASRAPVPQLSPDAAIAPDQIRTHETLGGGRGPAGEAMRRSDGEPDRRAPAERLDEIAHREYGDARYWRLIASFNDVADPLRVPEGRRLGIPSQAALGGSS